MAPVKAFSVHTHLPVLFSRPSTFATWGMATSLTGDERIPLLSATPVESLARLKDNGDTGRNARSFILLLELSLGKVKGIIFDYDAISTTTIATNLRSNTSMH